MNSVATGTRIRSGDIMLVAFLATVVMLFAGFTSAYLIRRAGADWVAIELPLLVWGNTLLLLASSVTLEIACRRRNRKSLWLGLAMGVTFLVGQLLVWRQLAAGGIGIGSTPQASFFYTLSAIHALHLLGGLGIMIHVLRRSAAWRTCANYWHFMGIVWIYVLFLFLAQ